MIQAHGVVPFDKIQIISLIQHRKCKRTLNLFSHIPEAVRVEGFFLLNEPNGNVAVRFDLCLGQAEGTAQVSIIM